MSDSLLCEALFDRTACAHNRAGLQRRLSVPTDIGVDEGDYLILPLPSFEGTMPVLNGLKSVQELRGRWGERTRSTDLV